MPVYRVSILHGREARSFDHDFADVDEAKGALARLVGRMLVHDDTLAWLPSGFALDMSDSEGHQLLSLNLTSAIREPVAPVLDLPEVIPLAANAH